jgi:hypothetical protein
MKKVKKDKRRRFTYEMIKYFIEIESDSKCKLLSNKYVDIDSKLDILCPCGEIFQISFYNFETNNKRKCNKCSKKLWGENSRIKYSEVTSLIYELGYKIIGENYETVLTKLILEDVEGYYYYSTYNDLRRGFKPSAFHYKNPYTIQNIKLWCKLNNKPFELVSIKYEDSKKKLKWKCLKEDCGEIFETSWHDIFANHGCGYCHGLQIGLSNCLATKRPDLAEEWDYEKNGDLTPYQFLRNSTEEVYWKCKECGSSWKAKIVNRNSGSGCIECNKSHGEKKIKKFLDINDINYISQK